jgi:hypothetical protein
VRLTGNQRHLAYRFACRNMGDQTPPARLLVDEHAETSGDDKK